MPYGAKESGIQKIKVLAQEMRKFKAFGALFETDREILWLIEVPYAVNRDRVHWILVRLHEKIKGLNQEIRKI